MATATSDTTLYTVWPLLIQLSSKCGHYQHHTVESKYGYYGYSPESINTLATLHINKKSSTMSMTTTNTTHYRKYGTAQLPLLLTTVESIAGIVLATQYHS